MAGRFSVGFCEYVVCCAIGVGRDPVEWSGSNVSGKLSASVISSISLCETSDVWFKVKYESVFG